MPISAVSVSILIALLFALPNAACAHNTDSCARAALAKMRFGFRSSSERSVKQFTLSNQELALNKRPDGAWMAGEKWPGVWTRDISYSSELSLGLIDPDATKKSLMAKVKNGKIIQDVGTGGSWPVSTDRMTWSLGAWEAYKATGDRKWLEDSYKILKKSMDVDLQTIFDKKTGLVRGEQSFLDWREQSYPPHVESADIYNSLSLGTNAVHYRALKILEEMAETLGDRAAAGKYGKLAAKLKKAINKHFWNDEKGFYSQYLYGYGDLRTASDKSESLGETLTILFGIADESRAKTIIERMPVLAEGPTSFYPQNPGIPSYHNNGVWPFVVGYYLRAGTKVKNEKAVNLAIDSIWNAVDRYGTNKENFEAVTLDAAKTVVNSDRQLWSVAANKAIFYRTFFGMDLEKAALKFNPFIPRKHEGVHQLQGFKYANSLLDIKVSGWGDGIQSFKLDGKELASAELPSNLTGNHSVEIVMNKKMAPSKINQVENRFAPAAPAAKLEANRIVWPKVDSAEKYQIFRNGKLLGSTEELSYPVSASGDSLNLYEVRAVDREGWQSFFSKPIRTESNSKILLAEGQTPKGPNNFVLTTKGDHPEINYNVTTEKTGEYYLDARYSNGEGRIEGWGEDGNKCAIRSVFVDGKRVDALVMPQRGLKDWKDAGYTSPIRLTLKKGKHKIVVKYTELDENMNGERNKALIHHLRLTPSE